MGRKIRKDRVFIAVAIVVALIGLIVFFSLKGCKRTGNNNNGPGQSQTQQGGGQAQNNNNADSKSWPAEISPFVKEYKLGGEIVGTSKEQNEKGQAVYTVKYKGATIDSCFSYVKSTLEFNGEWTEVVTDEEYTFHREEDKFIVDMSCEPKGAKGYDFLIKVTVK